jgi:hypothetical protein
VIVEDEDLHGSQGYRQLPGSGQVVEGHANIVARQAYGPPFVAHLDRKTTQQYIDFMLKHRPKTNPLAAVAIAFLICGCTQPARQAPERPPSLSEASFPPGRLGYPLGKYLTIEGTRAERGKVGAKTLLVDRINGQAISPPIGLWIDNVDSLPPGTRCVLNGYESGRMIGLPREVAEKEKMPYPQAMWQFYRYFVVTSVVEPEGLSMK